MAEDGAWANAVDCGAVMTGDDSSFDLRRVVAAEMVAAHEAGRAPSAVSAKAAAEALDLLLDQGRLDIAEPAARQLASAFPETRYFRNLCKIFDALPPAGAAPPFPDDPENDCLVVRRPGADTMVVCFTGRIHRLGLPMPLAHRWLATLPASLVYLRDFRQTFHIGGIASLGSTRRDTVAALRDLARSLGARRIACYGKSGGLYASLLYGLELGAHAVLGLSGPTNLSAEFNHYLRTERLLDADAGEVVDLRDAYGRAAAPPKVLIVYGEDNWEDRIHAGYLAGLPTVTLRSLADCRTHNTFAHLIRHGGIGPVLDWLVNPG